MALTRREFKETIECDEVKNLFSYLLDKKPTASWASFKIGLDSA